MNIKAKIREFHTGVTVKSFTGLLLLIYVFIYLIPPGLIPHSEHDHLGEHDAALEADPCHISIYHPGVQGACHHKYHLSVNHGDCPLCHVTLVRQITPEPIFNLKVVHSIIPFQIFLTETIFYCFPYLQEDRGPPALFSI